MGSIGKQNKKKTNVMNREWYSNIEKQAAENFINLPIELQVHGYDYNFISKSYLNFFDSENNTRSDKLTLAKKFLKFIRSINKNRAKEELGEDFFKCFRYWVDNFSDLFAKQDFLHLEALNVITDAIDKTQFVEDIISLEELQKRVKRLNEVYEKEEVIDVEFDDFIENEYKLLNSPKNRLESSKFIKYIGEKDQNVSEHS